MYPYRAICIRIRNLICSDPTETSNFYVLGGENDRIFGASLFLHVPSAAVQ